jgi:hypothetical protein
MMSCVSFFFLILFDESIAPVQSVPFLCSIARVIDAALLSLFLFVWLEMPECAQTKTLSIQMKGECL